MSFQYFEADSHAATYDKFRPSPPLELIERIVAFLREKKDSKLGCAVDVGCGSGQSTLILAPYFQKVVGLDPSSSIIEKAKKKSNPKNVLFETSSAEKIDLADGSVDLVITVQAIHWFDLPKFYKEVERILSKDGILAIVGYHLPQPSYRNRDKELSEVIKKYYSVILGDYILPQSKKVYLSNYTEPEFNDVPFSKNPIVREENFTTEIEADVNALVGYISSWSGFQNYKKQHGAEKSLIILNNFEKEIREEIMKGESFGVSKQEGFKILYRYFVLLSRKD